jgi:hypothetical protein
VEILSRFCRLLINSSADLQGDIRDRSFGDNEFRKLSRASRNTSTLIATLCNVSNGTVSYDIIDILASWLIYARETGGVQKPGKNCINGCLFADPLFLFGGAE